MSIYLKSYFLKHKALILKKKLNKKTGRNNQGRITVNHRDGGTKKRYRQIYFYNISSKIIKFFYFFKFINFHEKIFFRRVTIEKDPFRNVPISLCQELRWGFFSYKIFDYYDYSIFCEPNYFFFEKDCNFKMSPFYISNYVSKFKMGSLIKNLEFSSLTGPKFGKALGSFCKIIRRLIDYSVIQLPSKKTIIVSSFNLANTTQQRFFYFLPLLKRKKAGFSRLIGFRPTVKGRAKNPVDHPHGGRTGRGRIPVTPWGKITKSVKTCSVNRKKARLKRTTRLLKLV